MFVASLHDRFLPTPAIIDYKVDHVSVSDKKGKPVGNNRQGLKVIDIVYILKVNADRV